MLSGSLSGNWVNLTSVSLVPSTTWPRFVGNVGFLQQKRGPEVLDFALALRADLNDV